MHTWWQPPGLEWPRRTAWSLRTQTWAFRRQRLPAWLLSGFRSLTNAAEEPERRAARNSPEGRAKGEGLSVAAVEMDKNADALHARPKAETVLLLAIAAAVTLAHLLTNGRYGFHRDELQFLSDARHLDWGFVAYPPLTPFVERIGLELFGLSMVGLRLFSVLAQAAAIVVTGLMARELGGGRLAQGTAALAVALSPLPLFEGTEFQYTTFDYLWWVLIAYFTIRLLRTENPRWWLP